MQTPGAIAVAKQLFNGVCLGMLGLTGFECTPSYISHIKPGKFPLVLRNLHISAIFLNSLLMVLVLAVLPLDVVLGGANVLSSLADVSGGHWLRILIVVDAIIVLCGGVLTGILSACELLGELGLHRVILAVFLKLTPRSRSPYVSILAFLAFGMLLYASASLDLNVVSQMFSLMWLLVIGLFPVSLLLLKFNRGRLRRDGRKTKLGVVFVAIVLVPVVLAGIVAYQPMILVYFLAYFIGILLFFGATQNKIHLLRWVYWIYDQSPILHNWKATKSFDRRLIAFMNNLKRQPVCIFAKTDEINVLFHMIPYVQKSEETSHLKIVHFSEEEKGIPSELEANAKILDEAFPETTIVLVLVYGTFDPPNVGALSHHLGIPQSLMFISCPGENFMYPVAQLGTRVISL